MQQPSEQRNFREGKEASVGPDYDHPPTIEEYPFANQLEQRKEDPRSRSGAKGYKKKKRSTRLASILQGGALGCDGDGDVTGSGNGSYIRLDQEDQQVGAWQARAWQARAWQSGSFLVRPGSDAQSGRVPRTTYIYLVGTTGRDRGLEVEVVVGEEKQSTLLSKATGVTCACVPEREAYTVRNLSEHGKTAVLYWTSPSKSACMLPYEQKRPRQAGKAGQEEVKEEMPKALDRLRSEATGSLAPASARAE